MTLNESAAGRFSGGGFCLILIELALRTEIHIWFFPAPITLNLRKRERLKMKKPFVFLSLSLFFAGLILFNAFCCLASSGAIALGTGDQKGVYHAAGLALAKALEQSKSGPRLKLVPTSGSVENLNKLLDGSFGLAIAQADTAYSACQGEGLWKTPGPQKNLQAVCSLHTEAVTLVGRADSNIKTGRDLKGKAVAIGTKGSGTRANAIIALSNANLPLQSLGRAIEASPSESAKLLAAGKIDAFFYTVGHPNKLIIDLCQGPVKIRLAQLAKVDDPVFMRFKYFVYDRVSNLYYKNIANAVGVDTFGIKSCIFTTSRTSPGAVYDLLTALMKNLSLFRSQHPALERLSDYKMTEGLTAPLHAGALKYFKEIGLR
jgi:TRAP transporter TAXI family solute receptor